MGIPEIRPYAMPTEADVPPSVAGWRPDPRRVVLLIHDMQNYFVDFFPSGQPPVTELLSNVARLRQAAAALRIPVVYSAQPGAMSRDQRGLLFDIWGPGMNANASCRAIVAEITPGPEDTVLTKYRYSAFHGSELATMIATAGRDQLLVCGVYAHVGCLLTASDAFAHNIETFLVVDAVADFSAEHHRMAMQYASQRCAVAMTTGQVLEFITQPRQEVRGDWPERSRPVAPAS